MVTLTWRSARRLGRVLVNLAALVLIGLALHSWPVRDYVRQRLSALATREVGEPVTLGDLRYNLTTLLFEADDVAIVPSSAGPMPRATARRIVVRLSWRALIAGRLELDRLLVANLDLSASSSGGDVGVVLRRVFLNLQEGTARELSGHVRLQGPASIRVGPATTRVTQFESGLTVDGRRLRIDALRLAAPALEVEIGTGTVDLATPSPLVSATGVWRASAPGLCALWLPPATCQLARETALHGQVTITGRATAPELRVGVVSTGLRLSGGSPIDVHGDAIVSSSGVAIRQLDATLFGGSASVNATLLFGGARGQSHASITWRLIDVAAASGLPAVAPMTPIVDGVAEFAGDLLDTSAITGTARAVLSANDPAAGGLRPADHPVAGDLHASAFLSKGLSRTRATITARIERGRWSAQVIDGRIGATTIDVDVAAAIDAEAALSGTLEATSGDVPELLALMTALGVVADVPPAARPFLSHASAALTLNGTTRRPQVSGALSLSGGPSGAPSLETRARLHLDHSIVRLDDVEVTRGQDRLRGALSYVPDRGAIDGRFTATVSDLGAAVRHDSTSSWQGSIEVTGWVGGTLTQPQFHADVTGRDVAVAADRTDPGAHLALGEVRGSVERGERIDVQLQIPMRHVEAAAAFGLSPARTFDVRVRANDAELDDLAALLAPGARISGRVSAVATVRGRVDAPADLEADLRLERLSGAVGPIPIALARPGRIRTAGSRLLEADLDLDADALNVQVARATIGDPVRLLIDGALPAGAALPDPLTLTLEALVHDDRVEVRRAAARSGGMTADGTADIPLQFFDRWLQASLHSTDETRPALAAHVDAHSLAIGALVRRFAPAMTGVEGTFDASLDARAATPTLDAVVAEARIEHGRIDSSAVRLEQQSVATISLENGVASLDGWRWTAPGTGITLRGALNLLSGAATVAVAGDVDLGAALRLVDRRVAGTARVDVAATRESDRFVWTGSAVVHDGAWVSRADSIALTEVEASVECASGRCRVGELTGRLNDGTLAVAGELPMAGAPDARLRATLRGAGVELPRGARHDVDADLEFGGDAGPRLTGTVTVWPGTVSDSLVALASLVRAAPSADVRDPSSSPATSRMSRVPVDVQIVSGDDLTFDSHDLQLTATADLRLRGTLGHPQIRGRVATLDGGRIFLAGRTWQIEEGSIALDESSGATAARLAAMVTAQISKYVVRIRVSGSAAQPVLAMTSDPPLTQDDLAGLVLTGATTGNVARGGTQQVASMISSELLNSAGRAIGVDAVRIEQSQSELSTTDLEPVSRLTVSKRVTPRFDIVYSQGLSDSDDIAWVLVFRPGWRALDMRATIRTSGADAYEVRQELEFGAPRRAARTPRHTAETERLVSSVEVEGLPEDQAIALREKLSLKPGQRFTTKAWQRDREALSRYFLDRDRLTTRVRASRTIRADGRYQIAYRIVPGPTTRIDVRGYGVDRRTLDRLRDAWSRVVVQDLLPDELTDVVRTSLAARGYISAEVETRIEPLGDDGRLAAITVTPGQRVRARSIVFASNTAIDRADLERTVEERGLEPRCWLDPAVLNEPIAALYRTRGYLAATATATRTVTRDRARLTVQIDEGPQFAVGVVSLAGTEALGATAARDGLALAPGAPFSDGALSTALGRLRAAYLQAGHLDVAIESGSTIDREREVVDVTITVHEGRRSLLQAVTVTGGDATSPRLVDGLLNVETGGSVDPAALDRAQQRLYNTGIFRTVDIDTRPIDEAAASEDPRRVEAQVLLEERAAYRLRYGVQFGPSTIESITNATDTAEPGATFDLQRRNLFGQGIVLGGGAVWSTQQHRLRGTLAAPTLGTRFVSTTFSIEQANQDRSRTDPTSLQIVDRSVAAVLEQRWKFGRVRRVELAYGFDVDHRRLELKATTEQPLPLRARLADLDATITYDTRDNRFNAHQGMFHSSRVEAGAGLWLSDIAFTRYQLQQYLYFPAGRATLASGLRFGALDVDDQRDPAALLLFFRTGGATSVRGYDTDTLTPAYVLGLPAGGKVLLVLNQELRVPVTRRFGVVAFVDAGNTFTGLDTLALQGLKVGIGTGLRVDTPVAILRLDVAAPVPRLEASPRARWYFSIGQAF